MKRAIVPAIGALLSLTLFACQQTPTQTPNSKALGTLELTFDSQSNKASALVHAGNQTRAVQTNANVTFSAPATLGVLTDAPNSVQYINATFNVNNLLGSALNDVTLIAYQKTGNMGGTALKNIYNFAGSSIYATNDATGIAFAQAVKPVNAPSATAPSFTVNNAGADLQLFTETELTGLDSAANTAGELSTAGGEYLMPYGFVARNGGSSRILNASTNAAGTVNIAIQVPTSNSSPANTGYRFTMTFVIFDTPVTTRVSESLQEQGAGSGAITRSTSFNTNQIAAMVGSSLLQTNDKLVNACRVRTAGTAVSPTAFLVATAPISTAGSFDQCFAAAGKRQININAASTSTANGSEKIIAMAIQPDGKIVLAGWSAISTAAGADFLVMRLNPDGSFDRSFDTDGKATFSVGTGSATDEAHAVVLQSDGKIVLGGCAFCNATTSNFAMIRVNTDGSLDTTGFASSGIFTANSSFNNADDITGLALQTVSGVDYIVAAGFARETNAGSATGNPSNQHGALFRLRVSDGTLDTSGFGVSGYRFFSFQGSSATPLTGTLEDFITGVVVDANNKIIIGGNDSAFTAGVIRFTTTGAWDIKATSSFGTGGVNGVLLSGTSAIVFGGAVPTGGVSGNEFFAMKLNLPQSGSTDGTLDTTWGNQNPTTGRTYITVTANSDTARAGAFQTDGKIILAGRLRTGGGLSTGDTALVRLNTNGTADTTFDTDGIVTVQRQNGNVDEALATVVNAGKIILGGYERINANAPIEDDVFVLQFNP
jgi:uncharacterized delta-60 repeat protein